MKKLISLFVTMVISLLAVSAAVSALDILEVEFDDDQLDTSGSNFVQALEKGDEFEVKVRLRSDVDREDVQVEAELRGYDHDDRVEDITDTFDMKANVTYTKRLNLNFPVRLDQDRYLLRIQVEDRNSPTVEETYSLEIESPRHLLRIKDVIFNPENSVRAGRALLTTVRLENLGLKDEDGVKVRVSIPELGVSASDFIDEIELEGDDDDEVSSEELFIRIPTCADSGVYDVEISAEYDDGDEREELLRSIRVVEDDSCPARGGSESEGKGQVLISAGASQDVAAGEGSATFPLTITNDGQSSRTFTIQVNGVESFGTYRVSPSNVVVIGAGETQSVFVSVSADDDASEGAHMFSVSLGADGRNLKDVPMTVNVVEGEEGSGSADLEKVRRGLEIGLIVLVILLVILGLIIGLSKLRNDDESEETYY